jgi:hypothetical protein
MTPYAERVGGVRAFGGEAGLGGREAASADGGRENGWISWTAVA